MKYLVFLLAYAMAAQTGPVLSITAPTGGPATSGSQVTVPISLATPVGSAQPAATQFTFSVGKDITAANLVIGVAGTAASKTLSCGTFSGGNITCILWGMNTNLIGNGIVAQATLTLATALTVTNEALNLVNVGSADPTGTPLATGAASATMLVVSACDLNGDGKVDIADINVVVSQAIAGGMACTTGDMNKDGKCDVLDVYREVLAAIPANASIPGSGVCKVGP